MEKVLYLLWRPAGAAPDAWRDDRVLPTARALAAAGARDVTADVADGTVADAVMRIATHPPLPDAVVSAWVDTATDDRRAPLDALVAGAADRWGALLVTESVPLAPPAVGPGPPVTPAVGPGPPVTPAVGPGPPVTPAVGPGPPVTPGAARTPGYAQVAFLRVPAWLDREAWLARWLGGQTAVAIATQATFGYTQHLVARTLVPLPGWPPVDAVVEELFPIAARGDLHAFFGSGGDDEELARRMEAMAASTTSFIDPADLDVLPTSRYELR